MLTLLFIIFLALAFDFLNGFHDAANSIATVVSTRVLSPRYAVIWAAFFNFVAFLVLGLHVASTIGKDLIHPDVVDLTVIGAGLISAIIWNLMSIRSSPATPSMPGRVNRSVSFFCSREMNQPSQSSRKWKSAKDILSVVGKMSVLI